MQILIAFGVLCVVLYAQAPSTDEQAQQEIARQLDERLRREILKSLASVSVRVSVDGDMTSVESQRLRVAIELRLRTNGVPVRDGGDFPRFAIGVTSLAMPKDGFKTGLLQAMLIESVVLERNGVRMNAETWSATGFLVAVLTNADKKLTDGVTELVDRFSNDYLAANPKQP